MKRPSGGVAIRTSTIEAGQSIRFGARHVHDIVNVEGAAAISVHVYAPRLSSMTYYRMTDDALEARTTVHYRFGEAVA